MKVCLVNELKCVLWSLRSSTVRNPILCPSWETNHWSWRQYLICWRVVESSRVVSPATTQRLRQYITTDTELLRDIPLPQLIQYLIHGSSKQFILFVHAPCQATIVIISLYMMFTLCDTVSRHKRTTDAEKSSTSLHLRAHTSCTFLRDIEGSSGLLVCCGASFRFTLSRPTLFLSTKLGGLLQYTVQ